MQEYIKYLKQDSEQHIDEDFEEINEGFFKSASKVIAANKVRTIGNKVKQAKTEKEKLDLIASQNTWLAGLMLLKN